MPTYDYYCPENGEMVSVFHGMSVHVETWGEVCDMAALDAGQTSRESPVEKQIGAGIAMPRMVGRPNQLSGFGGTCCGTDGCHD